MSDADYRSVWHRAKTAEGDYLNGVVSGQRAEVLAGLAIEVREAWVAVESACALGEAGARKNGERLPLRQRRAARRAAWRDLTDWSVRSSEAATRVSVFGALMAAHLGRRPELNAAPPATPPAHLADDRLVHVVS